MIFYRMLEFSHHQRTWSLALKWFSNVFLNLYLGLPLTSCVLSLYAFVDRFCDISQEPMISFPQGIVNCVSMKCVHALDVKLLSSLGHSVYMLHKNALSWVLGSQSQGCHFYSLSVELIKSRVSKDKWILYLKLHSPSKLKGTDSTL